MMSKIHIKEAHNRNVLAEGRNQGMGFAMLKRIDDTHYETVQPISPCKDYLAEVIFTENQGVGTQGCGLNYPKVNKIFDDYAYMAIKNMVPQGQSASNFHLDGKNFDQYGKEIDDGIENIQALLNEFDKVLGLKRTKITPANDDQYFIKFSTKWAKSTQGISLFSLLVRIGKEYKIGEPIKKFLERMTKMEKHSDKFLVSSAMKKLEAIIDKGKLPKQPKSQIEQLKKPNSYGSPHNWGIVSWNGKFE